MGKVKTLIKQQFLHRKTPERVRGRVAYMSRKYLSKKKVFFAHEQELMHKKNYIFHESR